MSDERQGRRDEDTQLSIPPKKSEVPTQGQLEVALMCYTRFNDDRLPWG